jgi:probable F420-dependent oxidoreductase
MKCSYWPSTRHGWSELVADCQDAERLGWDGVWVPDHFMPAAGGYAGASPTARDPELGPLHEAWTTLAALSVAVPRVRMGTLVTANTHRPPAVVAKMAATVDHISGGRCVLGLGAGWQENEHRRYGLELPQPGERFARFDEACEVIRALLCQERSDFYGRYYELEAAPLEPKPVQARLPLLIGGTSPRALEIAARHADEWNGWGKPEVLVRLGQELDEACERVGRDPATITRSANAMVVVCDDEAEAERARRRPTERPTLVGTPAQLAEALAAYATAGVTEFVAPDFHLTNASQRQRLRATFVEVVRSM